MIKLAIFDLDGTLLDTINSIAYYVNKTFQNHGIDTVTPDECNYFAGNGAKLLVKRALEARSAYDEDSFPQLLAEYKAAYDTNPTYLTDVFPGIRELLCSLRDNGIKIAVLSNKPDFATKSVVSHFFGDIFDEVLGGRDGVALKPDPSAALDILKGFSVSADEVAFIGDTATDIETGKNMGAKLSIGVLWGFRPESELRLAGADVVVSSANQILSEVLAVD